MKKSSLTEFEIEEEGLKLRIRRSDNHQGNGAAAIPAYAAPVPAYTPPPAGTAASAATDEAPAAEEEGIVVIKSPMVGTFYQASSPESPPFVNVGDSVNTDTTVCIIEAMKVMNEIPAELSGTIKEVLVENGDAVEYGQPLFKVKS